MADFDASGPVRVDPARWKLSLTGLVENPISWTFDEFNKLPKVQVFADFHCVTRWSRLGNLWQGVSTKELVARAGGLKPGCHFVLAYGFDYGWTTNCPLRSSLQMTRSSRHIMMANRSIWRWRARAPDCAAPVRLEKREVAVGCRIPC